MSTHKSLKLFYTYHLLFPYIKETAGPSRRAKRYLSKKLFFPCIICSFDSTLTLSTNSIHFPTNLFYANLVICSESMNK